MQETESSEIISKALPVSRNLFILKTFVAELNFFVIYKKYETEGF